MRLGHVIVLGGGISGLAATHYIKQLAPNIRVTLLEQTSRLGGWVKSIYKDGYLFETGPRSIRPKGVAGANTLQLVHEMGLTSSVLFCDKKMAELRYIFKNRQLHQLPTSLSQLFKPRSPLFQGLLHSLLREATIAKKDLYHDDDQSVYEFFASHFGLEIADNVIDPLVHGIFAGDARQLSVRSCFPKAFQAEGLSGSLVRYMIRQYIFPHQDREMERWKSGVDKETLSFVNKMTKSPVYTLQGGLGELIKALEKSLRNYHDVDLKMDCKATQIKMFSDHVVCQIDGRGEISADCILSAVPASIVAGLLMSEGDFLIRENLSRLSSYVNVGVVNCGFSTSLEQLSQNKLKGFGYLVPSSEKSPVLGATFDSLVFPENYQRNDNASSQACITMMLGGHLFQSLIGDPKLVSSDRLYEIAIRALRQHLSFPEHIKPDTMHASLHHHCIPQYLVGHSERLQRIDRLLRGRYADRLVLLGSSYYGVGLNDCIWQARRTVEHFIHHVQNKSNICVTGLEFVT